MYEHWLLVLLLASLLCSTAVTSSSNPPHIVLVLVDDYGWANVGFHNNNTNEVLTPNLNSLAKEYTILDRMYSYKICSPSRCSIQTGRNPVHVNTLNVEPESYNPEDPISGFAGIPRKMTGIATKLKALGYSTAMTGKWDAGMATEEHTPKGRGYNQFLGYYHHANDYWKHTVTLPSIGTINVCLNRFVDLASSGNENGDESLAKKLAGTAYEEELFTEHTLSVIAKHDISKPLFLFHSFHLIHTPLHVPDVWLSAFEHIDYKNRKLYAAMVFYMDHVIGSIVSMLKSKAMWENTLMIFLSDNGGPVYNPGSANNWPLRGGKYSDWEGGVRVNALMAGGVVPSKLRGKPLKEYIHISDLYTTLISIAGGASGFEHDDLAAKYGLPPVDGLNLKDLLLGKTDKSKRTEIHLSEKAIIIGTKKLVVGLQPQTLWQGPVYPNKTGLQPQFPDATMPLPVPGSDPMYFDCGTKGCLFDIFKDPTEHHDLADSDPDTVKKLKDRLMELNKGVFKPNRGEPTKRACVAALLQHGGHYGPFIPLQELDSDLKQQHYVREDGIHVESK